MIVGSLVMGVYISRRQKYRRSLLVSVGVFGLAVLCISRFGTGTLVLLLLGYELLYGIADGLCVVGSSSIAQHYLSMEEIGRGMAFTSFASTFGNSLGAALTGAILQGVQNFGGNFCNGLNSVYAFYALLCIAVFAAIMKYWPAQKSKADSTSRTAIHQK